MRQCRKPPSLFRKVTPVILVGAMVMTLSSCEGNQERNIENKLKRLDYAWSRDEEGDFVVQVPLPDGEVRNVGIQAFAFGQTNRDPLREIWAVSRPMPTPVPMGLAESLLALNWSSKAQGFWALPGRTSRGETLVVYLIRLPLDATLREFETALREAAEAVQALDDSLPERF